MLLKIYMINKIILYSLFVLKCYLQSHVARQCDEAL